MKVINILEKIKNKLLNLKKLEKILNSSNIKNEISYYRKRFSDFCQSNNSLNLTELFFAKNNKGNDIKISVVTPVFNGEKFIKDILLALQKQTIAKYIEWLVVDDCSSDSTVDYLVKLSENLDVARLIILKNTKNLGASYSLRIAVDNANSDIIAWCSVDDFYVSPNKLEIDYEVIVSKKADLVFSKYIFLGSDLKKSQQINLDSLIREYNYYWNNINDVNQVSNDNLKLVSFLFFYNFLNGSSVVFNKGIYYKVGGFDEFLLNVDADWDLFVKMLLLNSKIFFSNTKIFNRIHSNQTSYNLHKMVFGTSLTRIRILKALQQTNYLDSIINYFALFIDNIKKRFIFPFGNKFPFGFNWLLNFSNILFFYFYLFYNFSSYLKVNVNINKFIDFETWQEFLNLVDFYLETRAFRTFLEAFNR